MELGMIGLGKMGSFMAIRLLRGNHRVVGHARTRETVNRMVEKGIEGAYSIEELTKKLVAPRVVWMMIPAGDPIDRTIESLLSYLEPNDIIIDGGNSYYKDTLRRATNLRKERIHYVDVGTSGGVWGVTEGYSMMVGGKEEIVEYLRPIFETLAPAQDKGWGYVGSNGSGHFVKMVHNGIEYGLMEAYSEGFSLIKRKEEFKLNLYNVAEIWRYGSVIRSWLLDLISVALKDDSELKNVEPFVADSGEGRWTVFEAIEQDIAIPVITLSLLQRLRSRDKESFSDRLLAVMREQFGGHIVKRNEQNVHKGKD